MQIPSLQEKIFRVLYKENNSNLYPLPQFINFTYRRTIVKKLLSFALALLLALGSCIFSAAADDPAYSVSINGPSAAGVNDLVTLTVNVDAVSFNAAQISIQYDASRLAFIGAVGLGESTGNVAVAKNGVVKIVDFGEPNVLSYTLQFRAISAGVANFRLLSAGFGTEEDSAENDLTPATVTRGEHSVYISQQYWSVSYPLEWFVAGQSYVMNGESILLQARADKWANYDYGTVSYAYVGSGYAIPLYPSGNGMYILPSVSGDVIIYVNPTPKSYPVTISGETAANSGTTATYGAPYAFTLPNDVAPTAAAAGATYTLGSVTVGGVNVAAQLSVNGRQYTIPGNLITGPVAITVTRTAVESTDPLPEITVSGATLGEADITVTTGADGKPEATLTVIPDDAYTYEVTATVDGKTVRVDADGNAYTVSGITGNLDFQIKKNLRLDTLTIVPYTAAGTNAYVYLVRVKDTTNYEHRTYKCDDTEMYWSEDYDAYCTLLISEKELTPKDVARKISLVSEAAAPVLAHYDVNKTGTVDANDVQFVYNMYKGGKYTEFTDSVSVKNFLLADQNGDGKLSVLDALIIVNHLFS